MRIYKNFDMSSCKGRTIEQNNTSSFDDLINKFKKYHRYGEIKFAIAELKKVRGFLFDMQAPCSVLDGVDQQIKDLRDKLNENKD